MTFLDFLVRSLTHLNMGATLALLAWLATRTVMTGGQP
jgi:hypothetical protein